MNWFQRFFGNPNVHSIASAIVNAAQPVAFMLGHPEVGIAMAAIGTAAGLQSAALPENPVAVPMPVAAVAVPGLPTGGPVVHLPPAAAGGSYHANDWLNLAALLTAQFVAPPAAPAPVLVSPVVGTPVVLQS